MEVGERNVLLQEILQEIQYREDNRNLKRQLRDTSNPFALPEENFRRDYRLTKGSARELFLQMLPHFDRSRRITRIPPVIRFVVALHFFAHGSYQKSLARDRLCAMSQASVSRCIREVCDILINNFAQTYIRFPTEMQDIVDVKTGFFEKFYFPGVLGCVDGTHVKIYPPPAMHPDFPGNVFINRKNFHSINCQIICDSNLRILAIDARYPGSVNDAAIWMMSSIKQWLFHNFQNGDRTTWLLGDSGYPLTPFLLTPIVGADPDTPEGRYTTAQILTRNCVERCIGVLKALFRCLRQDRALHYTPPVAAKIIYSCCILYNIVRNTDFNMDDVVVVLENDDPVIPDGDENLLDQGRVIRHNLIQQHFL